MGGVVEGIEKNIEPGEDIVNAYAIDNLEMTFGVNATLGAGKAVEAFLTASSISATLDELSRRSGGGNNPWFGSDLTCWRLVLRHQRGGRSVVKEIIRAERSYLGWRDKLRLACLKFDALMAAKRYRRR